MDKVKIIVCAHKKCEMPSDSMYLPLHVGAEGKKNPDGSPMDFGSGWQKDNTGENISDLNPYFCELTGLYWAWKNLHADYIGLVHYRRVFAGKYADLKDIAGSAISYQEFEPLLDQYHVFVPKKRLYLIETLESHYAHTHGEEHLKICREIVNKRSPEYLKTYDKVLKRRWGYMFNMMILPEEFLDEYCSWLFDILFPLFKQIGHKGLSAFDSRYCGRVSEILFNVWLEQAVVDHEIKKEEIKEMKYIEDVDWMQKINHFLAAKFLKRNYRGSVERSQKQIPTDKGGVLESCFIQAVAVDAVFLDSFLLITARGKVWKAVA